MELHARIYGALVYVVVYLEYGTDSAILEKGFLRSNITADDVESFAFYLFLTAQSQLVSSLCIDVRHCSEGRSASRDEFIFRYLPLKCIRQFVWIKLLKNGDINTSGNIPSSNVVSVLTVSMSRYLLKFFVRDRLWRRSWISCFVLGMRYLRHLSIQHMVKAEILEETLTCHTKFRCKTLLC